MPTTPANQTAPVSALSRYLTVNDVALALDVSRDHVRRMLDQGILPYLDISLPGAKTRRPKIRIPAARVEAYLEAQLRTARRPVSA